MRTTTIPILLILLTSIMTGCKAASGQDVSYIFEIPADPIHVSVALDSNKTVEALIPVEGGSITATGVDGTVYTLEIPSDALLNETTISLTPVTSISGMPFGSEQTYAVQLGPEGLFLYNYAMLTITPAEEIPLAEQIVFGYLEEGKDVILAAPVVDSSEIKIQVLHFSGNGVTKGLLADIEPVRERLGGSAERRLDNALNAELIRLRNEGGDAEAIGAAYAEAVQQYEEQVVKPRVASAGESCAAGRLAIQSVFQLARWRALLGESEGGDPFANYPGLRDKAAQVCVVEEFELCVEEHVIHRMPAVWRGFERQAALIPGSIGDAVLREARELTIQCLTFRLDFESTGTINLEDGGYESTVTSEITLRYNPDEGRISGEADLVNEAFEWSSPCGATSIPGGGGPFTVFALKILTARPNPDALGGAAGWVDPTGTEVNLLLSFMPGNTSESVIIEICGSSGPGLTLPPSALWTNTFMATHIDELAAGLSVGEAGFVTTDWEIFGDEYFAKKEWIKESGEIVEVGTFKLYHTPGG